MSALLKQRTKGLALSQQAGKAKWQEGRRSRSSDAYIKTNLKFAFKK
ncbi:hypothetical protein [Lactococcus lactis]|uniref:Uncharacterized protein n=1 Tax=Lactococcus lactis TaxID=1358 RepID=A0A6M0M8Y7_9LACT|nr:hypothetical protein [Lactococcus lactis]NEX53767.1 hypothetical protein [Lactococcus lactis]NEX55705.1 hypothetical protein [Lactococcus lactis]